MLHLPLMKIMKSSPIITGVESFSRRLLYSLLLGTLSIAMLLQLFDAWTELRLNGMDFQQDYLAALRLRQGLDIYTPFSREEVAGLGVREELGFGIRSNAHPPLNALLIVPLTFLSYSWATLIWTLLSMGLLVFLTQVLLVELKLPLSSRWRWIGSLLVLNWYPVWLHLHLGQLTILLFGCTTAAWLCFRRGRDGWAGCFLAIAAAMKMYPAFLLGYALFRRRWWTLLAAFATIIVLVLLQTVIDASHWPRYIRDVAPHNAAEWISSPRNASLSGVSARLLLGNHEVAPLAYRPALEGIARIALNAAFFGFFVLLLWKIRYTPHLDGEFCLFLCGMLLLSPLSWEHGYIYLLLPLTYVWAQVRRRQRYWNSWPLRLAILAGVLSLLPTELWLLRMYAFYLPERIPSIYNVLAPGFAVFFLSYVVVSLSVLNQALVREPDSLLQQAKHV
jgi:hypothetical protein